ncbi:FAD-dependent oxidoreductase [Desulfovibrio oxyclinae]|uniref:FAD-dependent oxidoreductase n=1 Tax=Desulfovibrio oxyclinae TaxID=63560 RepID=UPI00035F81D3|nr:FAD-dependent oxidoreductase [Desulfovibrio oxyclinae]
MGTRKTIQTQVLIIGAGATGTGVMRDLALRGVHCALVDRSDVNAGASGGNHGLLHSGGRYVSNDAHAAAECREEGDILKKLAPQCVDETGGYFSAVAGDDENFIADFKSHCEKCGIDCTEVDPAEAREQEPHLAEDTIAVYEVPDASVDPFKLSLENVAHAKLVNNSKYLRHTEVVRFEIENGRIRAAICRDTDSGEELRIEAEQYVNAAGAWAASVAAQAGASVDMLYSRGTLLVTQERLSSRVINRLRPPSDGDILVPGGTVSILGTTSVRVDDPADARPTVEEVDRNVEQGWPMMPILAHTRYIRAYAGVRPLVLVGDGEGDGRSVSRDFSLFDHEDANLSNFCTITGGKLTTYRVMAERCSDLVASRLGVSAPCLTATEPLATVNACEWTEPGRAPKIWARNPDADDPILCECEMVPASAIDEIMNDCSEFIPDPGLQALGLRSRIGKGSCQGSFCGMRIAAHLYDTGRFDSPGGLKNMQGFFAQRFKGLRPVLWETQLVQAELAEALHCGLLGLEQIEGEDD